MKETNFETKSVAKPQSAHKRRNLVLIFMATLFACLVVCLATGCGSENNNSNNNNNNNYFSSYNITVYSSLQDNPYTLTLQNFNTVASIKSHLAVEGYTLVGVYEDAEYMFECSEYTVLIPNMKIYCKYEIKHFNVTLPSNTDWFSIQAQGELTNLEYGSQFKFTLSLDEAIPESEVTVKANGEILSKQGEEYVLTIKSHTNIEVLINHYTISISSQNPQILHVKSNGQEVQSLSKLPYGTEIEVSYTKRNGYTQFLSVNDQSQSEETKTYVVTSDMEISYTEYIIPYCLVVNSLDVIVTFQGNRVFEGQIIFHYGDEITVTPKEEKPGYTQTITVQGATQQPGTNTYMVTGNVVVDYTETRIEYTLTINQPDELTVMLNGVEAQTGATIYYGDELTITLKEEKEGYIQIISINGDAQQQDGTPYIVTGNVTIDYTELEAPTLNKLSFKYKDSGSLGRHYEVSCLNKNIDGKVIIPATYSDGIHGEYKVTFAPKIYDNPMAAPICAFNNCVNITEVIIRAGITKIEKNAFDGCSSLTSVTLESVEEIDEYAFYNCTMLSSVNLEGVITINHHAFCNTGLKEVNLNAAQTIGTGVFKDCAELTSATLAAATDISSDLFYNCPNLQTVSCPKANQVLSSAFYNCTNLRDIDLSNITFVGNGAFNGCTSLEEVNLSSTISIGNRAFVNCVFTTLSLPSVVTIYGDAFMGCNQLTTITLGASLTTLDKDAFATKNLALAEIIFEGTVDDWVSIDFVNLASNPLSKGTSLKINNQTVKSVKINKDVKPYAFYGYAKLTSVSFGSGVKSIGSYAFDYCYGISGDIDLSNVETIGASAFGSTKAIKVILGKNLKTINNTAFGACYALTEVVNKSGIEIDKENAIYTFSERVITSETLCGTFEEVDGVIYYKYDNEVVAACFKFDDQQVLKLQNNTTKIKYGAFYISYTLEQDLVGDYVYRWKSAITETIELPGTIKSIGSKAFEMFYFVKEVKFGGTIDDWLYIDFGNRGSNPLHCGRSALVDSVSLIIDGTTVTSATISKNVKPYAFSGYKKLKTIVLTEDVTSIGEYAFEENSIRSLTFSKELKTFGTSVFYNAGVSEINYNGTADDWVSIDFADLRACPLRKGTVLNIGGQKATDIEITVTEIKPYAFYNYDSLLSVTMGDNVTIGKMAFYGCTSLASVTIGKGIQILDQAFRGCEDITEVNIIGSINDWVTINFENIYQNPLYGGKAVLKINGEDISKATITTNINAYAFYNYNLLTSISLGKEVTSIGEDAFYECGSITEVNYTGSIEDWMVIDFAKETSNPLYGGSHGNMVVLKIDGKEVLDVTISSKVKKYAFYNYNFNTLTINEGASVENSSFLQCVIMEYLIINTDEFYLNDFIGYLHWSHGLQIKVLRSIVDKYEYVPKEFSYFTKSTPEDDLDYYYYKYKNA